MLHPSARSLHGATPLTDTPARAHGLRDMAVGLSLGTVVNVVAATLCGLSFGLPVAAQQAIGGPFGELVGMLGLFGMYWAMGFSVVQLVYLAPLGVVALLRGRPGVALGLLVVAMVTFLLQAGCVVTGVGFLMYVVSLY